MMPAGDRSASADEAVAAAGAVDVALAEAVDGGLTWVPFAAYLGCWLLLSAVSGYVLSEATPQMPARFLPAYEPLMWSAVALVAAGPVLSLVVWLVARARRPAQGRRGILASSMVRGSLAAFFGVAIWIATLHGLDVATTSGAL
jgi:hypothetical protein